MFACEVCLKEMRVFLRSLTLSVALLPVALAVGVGPAQVASVSASPAFAALEADDFADLGEPWQARVTGTGSLGLRVRGGPATTHPVSDTLAEGSRVELLEGPSVDAQGREWYRITSRARPGVAGWCDGSYLTEVDANEFEAAPVTPARAAPTAASARSFAAKLTAYAHGTRTASGTPVRWGVVAVDPRVIPLGSRIMIEGYDNVFIAEDTGGGVRGNHVDIYFPDLASAIRFGVQTRTVNVLN